MHDTDCREFDTDVLPEVLEKSVPVPPAGWSGEATVLVQARVLEDGTVGETMIVRSEPALDSAALACVRTWRFKPGEHCRRAKPTWVAIPLRFAAP